MEILKIYENLLTEKGSATCVTQFGKELFGQELGGTEKDTRVEKSYANLIANFSSEDYGVYMKGEFVKAISKLKDCMSQYKEVLMPENTTIYRGLTIPLKYFIQHNQPILTQEPFNYVYKANNPIQSWTLESDVAAVFGNNMEVNLLGDKFIEGGYNKSIEKAREFFELAKTEYADTRVAVILEHRSSKNDCLFKSKYFKVLSNNSHEEEMLRVNNEPITVKCKFNDHHDVFTTHDGMLALSIISKFIKKTLK